MSDELPEYVSGVRYMTAKAFGRPYRAVQSLAKAQAEENFALILEGDYGGQIYATCPVNKIHCEEKTLRQLLFDIDGLTWENPEGCGLHFEYAPIGTPISGGMGGGQIVMDVWVHAELHELGLATAIADVIHGSCDQLDVPSAEEMERRAQAGDAHAAYLLSHKIRHTDSTRSLQLLRTSAGKGNLGAMSLITKQNIPNSEKERWLIEIASRNELDHRIDAARSELAQAYVKGGFGRQEFEKAAALFQQTCNRRWSAYDAYQLGKMYRDGLGVEQNNVKALMWLLLSSVFDIRHYPQWHIVIRSDTQSYVVDAVEKLKALMPPLEVAEAERLCQSRFKLDCQ
jgi:hypothetical protein